MARKRVIDPDFWLDEELTSCTLETRLFYIATWNFSDDYGVLENSAKRLKAQVFPYDDIDVQPLIDRLIEIGKFVVFEKDGKNWLYIKNFLKWQRVDKPSVKRNPQSPFIEESESTQELVVSEEKRSKEKRSKEKRSKEKKISVSSFFEKIGTGIDQDNIIKALEVLKVTNLNENQVEVVTEWLTLFPSRDYSFHARKCVNWWKEKGKSWTRPISAFGNWLEKTKVDEHIINKKIGLEEEKKQKLREIEATKYSELSPEKKAELDEKMSMIKAKICL